MKEQEARRKVNSVPYVETSSTCERPQSVVFKDAQSSTRTRVSHRGQPNSVSNATGHVPNWPDQLMWHFSLFQQKDQTNKVAVIRWQSISRHTCFISARGGKKLHQAVARTFQTWAIQTEFATKLTLGHESRLTTGIYETLLENNESQAQLVLWLKYNLHPTALQTVLLKNVQNLFWKMTKTFSAFYGSRRFLAISIRAPPVHSILYQSNSAHNFTLLPVEMSENLPTWY